VKVGAGAGAYNLGRLLLPRLSFFGLTSAGYDAIGYALHAGAGYDLMLTTRLALVPFANVVQILAPDDPDPATGLRRARAIRASRSWASDCTGTDRRRRAARNLSNASGAGAARAAAQSVDSYRRPFQSVRPPRSALRTKSATATAAPSG
jgi:hypothetical protein